jgi:carbonic anhydrase/acetyltransferase-like protein (isoleucine patch superfamily)
MNKEKSWIPVSLLVPVFMALILGFPTATALLPVLIAPSIGLKLGTAFAAPFVFGLVYVGLAALLSLPFQGAIIPGKFPRVLTHPVYGQRRLYGLCWGAVFYFSPLYYAYMSVPMLRQFLLWSFGYRANPEINIAPDAWLRDLPLLSLDSGSYVANKATVGTNICLANGSILVDRVTLGKKAMIGHLSMIAPGCLIGDSAEIGVGCAIGIRAKIGNSTRIAPSSSVNHGALIGERVDVGAASYIGVKARIADGLKIPSGANIPEGAELLSQEDVQNCFSSETQMLREERSKLERIYASRVANIHEPTLVGKRASGE